MALKAKPDTSAAPRIRPVLTSFCQAFQPFPASMMTTTTANTAMTDLSNALAESRLSTESSPKRIVLGGICKEYVYWGDQAPGGRDARCAASVPSAPAIWPASDSHWRRISGTEVISQ